MPQPQRNFGIKSAFRIAFASVREQGWRSALSALGVMVGVTAILLLIGISRGVEADVASEVREIGVNVLIIMPGKVDEGFNPNLAGISFLTPQLADELRGVRGVVRTATITFAGGGVKYGKKEAFPANMAVSADWFGLHKEELQEGRLLTPADQTSQVVVLGGTAKQTLFGKEPALGKKVTINERDYEVVGVTRPKKPGSSLFQMMSFSNVAYIPYGAAKGKQDSIPIHRIMVQSAPEVEPKSLKAEIERRVGAKLDSTQFSVLTEEEIVGMVYKLMSILTWLVTGLTSIAIFVGGLGIMTVMLMSVGQRTKEIGVRKTVGARPRDVFWQFLIESLLIALMGGAAGLALSAAACGALARWTPIKPMLNWEIIGLGLGVSALIGCVFGLLPAVAASRRDAVVSLRNE